MTVVLAVLLGYLLGALPTAGWLGRLAGHDLRAEGSGNPGANNALRVGGPLLAATVLGIEAAKGLAAVEIGDALAGDAAAIAAGIAAVMGNVFNVYYRLKGGKGLGITLGVLAGVWPTVLIPVLIALGIGLAVLRSSGGATIIAIFGLNTMAVVWWLLDWPTGWGVDVPASLIVLAVAIGIIIWRRHWEDYMIKRQTRSGSRESASPAPR